MKIYQQEILDGLSDNIKAQASIAYCAPALLVNNIDSDSSWDISRSLINKIKASSNPNQIDLYYIKSILVSTGWNKNDDVFDPKETWAAKNTPEDKQFNFMHNENDIIGHITGSYVVDRNGNKILAEDDDNIPEEFDIVTEAVLYNSWTNPDNKERMEKIISEIEDGKWFVSMECLFAGFDYSVIDKNNNQKVIARNEESAFLTKHLKAYGGTGEYEGYKIGRSLKSISFSGKGLVSRPANPRSIILDSSKAFSAPINEGKINVISNVSKGDFKMSDINLEKQLADLQNELTASKQEIKTAQAENEVTLKEFADKVSTLESTLAEKDSAIKTFEERVLSLEEALVAKEKELSDLSAAMKDMKDKEKYRMRKANLLEAGFEESEAEESIPLYDSLDDSAFEAIVAAMKKKMAEMKYKMKKEEKEEKPMATETVSETKAAEAVAEEVTEELFQEVQTTEATLVDASDVNDELEAARASVAEWLTENVLRK
jgi:hypothetical protein